MIHDAILAPAVLGLRLVGAPAAAARRAGAVDVVLVLLGPAALVAIPVLGRFGAKADNPTLLDRDYPGRLVFAALCVCAGIAVALGELRSPRPTAEEE